MSRTPQIPITFSDLVAVDTFLSEPYCKMADAPKFDIKMLVLPAVMFFSKKIDFTDPNIVQMTQAAFVGGTVCCFWFVSLQC